MGGYFVKFPVVVVFRWIKTINCEGRTVRAYTRYKLNFPAEAPDNIGVYRRGPTDTFC